VQQHLAGGGQPHPPAGPLDQSDAHAALKLPDRSRQRRLRDAQPLRGAAEMQFLGDRYEVAQFPRLRCLHTGRVSIATQIVLACGSPGWSDAVMTHDATIALVTGANKGIGRAIAERLAGLGMTVLLAARDPQLGEQAAAVLRSAGGDAHTIPMNVTRPAEIRSAAEQIDSRFGRLDLLINNAGISGERGRQAPGAADLATIRAVFETNFFGVIMVTDAMLPLLRRSPAARIINVSSGVGSLHNMTDPGHYMSKLPGAAAYPTSKTALNALTVQYAKALAADHIPVNVVVPGPCATDFTRNLPYPIARTAAQGAEIAVRLATIGPHGPTGGFFDEDGPVPW
jgi:NAD(P)-dependent dehydrogenase (short-subunit alcohol dehydrogenase family)